VLRAKQYLVRGRVQGVGYRFFALETARRAGIQGWVRNLASGDVEVHAEGEEATLRGFKEKLERGPSQSRVTEVIETDVPATGSYSSFLIRG
jgi:acylphosphatase